MSDNLPPGSYGLPLLGETLAWAGDPFGFMQTRFEKHGPVFKTKLFGNETACFVDAEGWSRFLDEGYILREDGVAPHLSKLVGQTTLPFVDGATHKRHKKLLLEAFKPGPMRGYVPAVMPIFDRYFDKWAKRGQLSIYPEIERMTLVMFNTLFAGMDPEKEDPEFQRQLDTFMAGILALPLPFGAYKKGLAAHDWLVDYLLALVEERRENPGADSISFMIGAKDDDGNGLTNQQIADELVHVYFAGYGAMSANYGYALIALAKHPEVRDRLLAEIQDKTSAEPTFDELLGLEYAGQFFKELMRFYPVVPQTFFGRVVKPFEIHGYQIPEGWKATGVVGAALYDPARFSKPEVFDPDRFGPDRKEDEPAPHTFVPQGGGPPEGHRCLGESVSALVMKIFLTRLLPHYTWELTEEPGLARTFPASPKGGVPVRFQKKT